MLHLDKCNVNYLIVEYREVVEILEYGLAYSKVDEYQPFLAINQTNHSLP